MVGEGWGRDMGGGQGGENPGVKGTGTLWEVEEERVGGGNCQRGGNREK